MAKYEVVVDSPLVISEDDVRLMRAWLEEFIKDGLSTIGLNSAFTFSVTVSS